jgi:hypothetical protein
MVAQEAASPTDPLLESKSGVLELVSELAVLVVATPILG